MLSGKLQFMAFFLGLSYSPANSSPIRGSSLHNHLPSSFDVPLTWTPAGFTGPIEVGTPPQQLTAFFDWTWISQYVFSTVCYGQKNRPDLCLNPQQKFFNESKSTSFEYVPDTYPTRTWNPNHFFFYNDLTVEYATDAVSVGNSTTKAIIQASNIAFNMTTESFPFSGVYGLSPVFKTDNDSTSSPFFQGWKQGSWSEPLVAFHYCYNGSPDAQVTCNGHNATQTLGGINRRLIKYDKIWWYTNKVFPDVNNLDFEYSPGIYNYWGVELEALKIGNAGQPVESPPSMDGPAAIFDHASYGRGMPLSPNAYRKLIGLAEAVPIDLEEPPNNGNQSFYSVDCGRIDSLPAISYQFKGSSKEWDVTPHHYVEKVANGTCVLNVRTLASGDQFIGNFGETFSKDKYIIFDYENLKVGIADLQW
ncbi:eukaryotic aspartyl protease [Xylaria arbuscula]|nr:eukaryotic aspartyl protease [Xylaria arbuscula]